MRKFTKNLLWRVAALTMILGACSSINAWASTYKLVGNGVFGDWTWSNGIELTDADGDGYYTAVVTVSDNPSFKVVKDALTWWSRTTNDKWYYENDFNNSNTYGLSEGGSDNNMGIGNSYSGSLIFILTLDGDNPKDLTIIKNSISTIYAKGDFNNWGATNEFVAEQNNPLGFSCDVSVSAGDEFKINDSNNNWYGFSSDFLSLNYLGKANGSNNIRFIAAGNWHLTYNAYSKDFTAVGPSDSNTGFYFLRGDWVDEWNPTAKTALTKRSNNSWEIFVEGFSGKFQIYDATSNTWYGLGSAGFADDGVPYVLSTGYENNIELKTAATRLFKYNPTSHELTASTLTNASLASILSSGTNGNVYSISDALAIAAITEDGSRAYLTDGSNWIAAELGSFSSAVLSFSGGIPANAIVGTLSNRDTKPTITLTSIDLSDAVTPPSYSIANLDLTSSTFTAPKPCQLVNVVGYPNGGKLYGWGHHNESTHYINLATDYLSTAPSFTTDAKTTLENVAIELGEAISASAPRRAPASDYSNVTGQLTSPTMNVVTAVEDVNASKTVAGVKYYNLMGVESNQPFDGVNIIVTRYTDGTSQAVKVVK